MISSYELLRILTGKYKYQEDGLITDKNCDFIESEEFKKGYNAGLKVHSDQPGYKWGMNITQFFFNYALNIEGDMIDLGVWNGRFAISNIESSNFNKLNKKYYLCDSFKGLKKESKLYEHYKHLYSENYEKVKESFKDFKNVELVRGYLPESLDLVEINKISYIYVDLNSVEPEIGCLEILWDRISIGGIILLDDYGWSGHEEQKVEYDKFFKERKHRVLSLPTGQGLVIKVGDRK